MRLFDIFLLLNSRVVAHFVAALNIVELPMWCGALTTTASTVMRLITPAIGCLAVSKWLLTIMRAS